MGIEFCINYAFYFYLFSAKFKLLKCFLWPGGGALKLIAHDGSLCGRVCCICL